MKTSESLSEIAKALCKFQTEVQDAPKDSQAHNYKYADLGTILHLVRPVMAKNGLSITQFPCNSEGLVGVTTRLLHTSGEWMEESLFMPVEERRGMSMAQLSGGVITYIRRYSEAAILNITQVDDDAALPPQTTQPEQPPAQPAKPAPKPATDEQFAKINEFVSAGQIPPKTLEWLKVETHWNNLTSSQATKVLKACKDYGDKK